jgi:hypothetical protein
MNTFARLLQEARVGKWCKRGAILIAAFGVLQLALALAATWSQYQQDVVNGQNPYQTTILLGGLSQVAWICGNTIFYFLVLYIAGVVLSSLAAPTPSDVRFEDLEEEAITSNTGQQKAHID